MSRLSIIPASKMQIVEGECSISNVDTGIEIYSATKNYAVADEVVVLNHNGIAVNAIYMSAQVDEDLKNIGNDVIDSEYWVWVRPTNMYSALDYYPSTPTSSSNNLTMVYTMQRCDRFTLLELQGRELKVEQLDENNNVIRESGWVSLIEPPKNTLECLTYCPKQKSQYIFNMQFDINQKIRVTIKGSNSVGYGVATAGRVEYFGCVLCGIKPSSFLLKVPTRDNYGNVTLGRTDYVREVDLSISMKHQEYNSMIDKLQDLLAVPAMFVPIESESVTTTFGYFDRESSSIDCGSYNEASLKIISFKYKKKE